MLTASPVRLGGVIFRGFGGVPAPLDHHVERQACEDEHAADHEVVAEGLVPL